MARRDQRRGAQTSNYAERFIGTVEFDGDRITASDTLSSVVDGYAPEDLLHRFGGWSNDQ